MHGPILLADGSLITEDVLDPDHAPERFSDSPIVAKNQALLNYARCAFVIQTHLGKGAAARPRCIPHARGTGYGIEPFPRHWGDFALPKRHTGVCPPPSTRRVPDPFEPSHLQRGVRSISSARRGGPSDRRWHGPWSFGRRVSGRYHWPRPPFCASCGAVRLDAGAVDEQPVGNTFAPGQRAEDAFPDAALGPAHEAVVERLLLPVDRRAIAPASAALQGTNSRRCGTLCADIRRRY